MFGGVLQRLWDGAEVSYKAKILDSLPVAADAYLLDVGCDDGAWTETVRAWMGLPAERVIGLEAVRPPW